jgi:hypothetical protein
MTRTPANVRDAAARLVARTCEAQGLPTLIVDPAALARAAAFMVPRAAGDSVNSGPANARPHKGFTGSARP